MNVIHMALEARIYVWALMDYGKWPAEAEPDSVVTPNLFSSQDRALRYLSGKVLDAEHFARIRWNFGASLDWLEGRTDDGERFLIIRMEVDPTS